MFLRGIRKPWGASWNVGGFGEQFVAKFDWGVAKVPIQNKPSIL